MTTDDGRRFARQLWCVHCLGEIAGRACSLAEYVQRVVRYSAGIGACQGCGKASEPMSDVEYATALRAKVRERKGQR